MTDAQSRLSESDYRRLLAATRTYREELVARLAGEVGLRPQEMARVRIADGREHVHAGTVYRGLSIEGREGRRFAFVPRPVWDSLVKFAHERERDDSDPVFSISARRIQMIVSEVGDRVDGLSVSTRSLRRLYARRLLEDGVDPIVVRTVGGWSSLDTVLDSFEEPGEAAIVRAMTADGALRDDRPSREDARSGRGETALDALLTASASLETAGSRADVEQTGCEAVVDAGYDAAWVTGVTDNGGDLPVREAAGIVDASDSSLASLSIDRGAPPDGETRTVDVGTVAEPAAGLSRGHVVIDIPIEFGDTSFGTLSVATRAENGLGERERAILADLGHRLGGAITTVTRRRLLRADTVTELEFRITDERSLLVGTAAACGCTFELEGHVPISERSLVLYVRVTGSAPETVVEHVLDRDAVSRARLIRSTGDAAVVELAVTGDSIAATLGEFGGNVTAYVVDDGGTITAEFPTDVDVRSVVRGVTAAFPETEFVARRDVSHPASMEAAARTDVMDELTDRQRSVLRSAYLAGYFDWPRGTTAEELATALDISSPTLHNHLRKAQRSVLDELFADRSP